MDIHFGAEDAIFPHHTNEIAQSESYLGHKWCNYWVHLSWLLTNNVKMSKSLGHVLTASKLKEEGYNPLSYRYFILNSYYHKQVNFTFPLLDQAESSYLKLLNRISLIKNEGSYNDNDFRSYDDKFKECLANDMNTSNAITLLYELMKDREVSGKTKLSLIESWDKVFGLDLLKTAEDDISLELKEYISEMILKRNEAKKNKDFAEADKIRDELLAKKIVIKDTREGTVYEIIK